MKNEKPYWKDAPEWANWLAQDADGRWVFFKDEPFPCTETWGAASAKDVEVFGWQYAGEWLKSKESRPGKPVKV